MSYTKNISRVGVLTRCHPELKRRISRSSSTDNGTAGDPSPSVQDDTEREIPTLEP